MSLKLGHKQKTLVIKYVIIRPSYDKERKKWHGKLKIRAEHFFGKLFLQSKILFQAVNLQKSEHKVLQI